MTSAFRFHTQAMTGNVSISTLCTHCPLGICSGRKPLQKPTRSFKLLGYVSGKNQHTLKHCLWHMILTDSHTLFQNAYQLVLA